MIIETIRSVAIGLGVMILVPLITHVGIMLIINEPVYLSKEQKKDEILVQQNKYDRERFNKFYFLISAIVGIVAIIAGILIPIPFLGMGFILGGVISLASAYLGYWGHLSLLIKFVSFLAALILLIGASIRFTRNAQKSH